jgi:hypothetical protein
LWAQSSLNKSNRAGVAYLYHNDSIKMLDFHQGVLSCLSGNRWIPYDSLPEMPEIFRQHAHPQPSVLQTHDTTLISFSGSGVVYFMRRNGKVERHDRTYFSGYNFGALKHFDGKRLWSLGGYGLWRVTDHALYYDAELREWEREVMTPNIIEGFGDGFYTALRPGALRMVVSSRTEFNGTEVTYSVYDVDLEERSYRYVGAPRVNLDMFNNQDQLGFSIWDNRWGLLFEGNKVLLGNLVENRLLETRISNTQARPFDGLSGIIVHPDGVLIIETASTATNDHVKIIRTTLEELLANPNNVDLGPIYEPHWMHQIRSNLKLILALLLGIGGLTALILRYQRGRPVAEQLFAEALTTHQKMLFKHLMLLTADQSITTLELNQLLGIDDKSWDNQRKIRSTVLQELEEKGMEFLGVPSFIERTSNEDDRRLRRYRIKTELRDELISVLKYV